MAKQIPLKQAALWQSDDEFELLLKQSLSAIQPPADFSSRVMAAVHEEAAAKKTAAPAKVIPFAPKRPLGRSFWPGLGTIAASLALFLWAALALPGGADAPGSLPQLPAASNLQVAAEIDALSKPHRQPPSTAEPDDVPVPAVTGQPAEPSNVAEPNFPEEPQPREASQPAEPNSTVEPAQPNSQTEPTEPTGPLNPAEDETGSGELILPRAAFGTEATGTLSVRLLAEVENNQIYTPAINRRGSTASFYTADEENVYSWRVDLSTANSPEVALVTSRSAIDDIGSLLVQTTEPCDATTLVASPDNTIMAQNSPDGLWISLAEGEVYNLSEEAGGSLLAWSPDSSKLLFTNSQGQLFMGYPLEKRIYQITDLSVEDVCWSTDNQTIIFLTNTDGQDALYIAELI